MVRRHASGHLRRSKPNRSLEPALDSFDIVLVPDTSCRWFAETGQALCGPFLEYWNAHGALAAQGYPISDEFTEVSDLNGKPYRVQYFERAVFERHPENDPPYDVLLAQLGTLCYRAKYPPAERIIVAIPMPAEPVKIALGGGYVWVVTTDRQGGGSPVRIAAAAGRTVGDLEPVGFESHDSLLAGGVYGCRSRRRWHASIQLRASARR